MSVEEVPIVRRPEAPQFIEGPWTRPARERAIAEEVRLAYIAISARR